MNPALTQLLPHRPPIVFIDTIELVGSDATTARMTFPPGSYATDGDRVLETALIEALAQTVAAAAGHAAQADGRAPGAGMLVGLSDFQCMGIAQAGLPVELAVTVTRRLPPFLFARGEVRQEGRIIATGELKFYLQDSHE